MQSPRMRWLLMAGTIVSGVLAGGVLDRIIAAAGRLLLAAALSRFIDDRSHFAPGLPVYLAAAFAIAGLAR
jgi:hypothetical protein